MGAGRQQLFDVHVTEFGLDRQSAVSGLQEVLQIGAGDAERFVRDTPVNVCESLPEEQARAVVQQLRSLGARVALLPSQPGPPPAPAPTQQTVPQGTPVGAVTLMSNTPAGAGTLVSNAPAGAGTLVSNAPAGAGTPAIHPPPRAAFSSPPAGPAPVESSEGPLVFDPAGPVVGYRRRSQSPGAERMQMSLEPPAFAAAGPQPTSSQEPTDQTLPLIEPLLTPEERQQREQRAREEALARQAEQRPGAGALGLDPNSLMPALPDMDMGGLPALPELGRPDMGSSMGPSLELDDSSLPVSRRPSMRHGDGDSFMPAALGGAESSLPPALMGDPEEDGQQAPAQPAEPGQVRRWLARAGTAIARAFLRLQEWAEDIEREDDRDTALRRVRVEFAVFVIWALEVTAPAVRRLVEAAAGPGAALVDRAERALGEATGRSSTIPPEPEPEPESGVGDDGLSRWPPPRLATSRRPTPLPEGPDPGSVRALLVLGGVLVIGAGIYLGHSIFLGNASALWVLLHAGAFYALGVALWPRKD